MVEVIRSHNAKVGGLKSRVGGLNDDNGFMSTPIPAATVFSVAGLSPVPMVTSWYLLRLAAGPW